jgi:hypothetical protein
VYDPALLNPLYNVTVYVPAYPLQALPRGVPTGADMCSCGALFKSGALASSTTDEKGQFTLTNAPAGTNVQLVLQVGKWRRVVTIPTVTACQANAQADKSLALNASASATNDSMPDIAVSTGHSDTLECLLKRIGVADTEWVAGASTAGHVHVFSGGSPALAGQAGGPEQATFPGAPESDTNLWDVAGHLMPYDMLLLSCEGQETYNPNPAVLEQYLNVGGRAFASHFHYKWFDGDPNGVTGVPPADWGTNLATWTMGTSTVKGPDTGIVVQTLNVGGGPFPKGISLDKWLGNVGALGVGVPAGDLPIYQPKYNAVVGPTNTPSQPWITDQANGGTKTMYFSFDTPVTAKAAPDGGPPAYCGRAVFSDLHVDGDTTAPSNNDSPNKAGGMAPPQGCAMGALSPQEKVLEFMLFDLSACVISDSVPPMKTIPVY